MLTDLMLPFYEMTKSELILTCLHAKKYCYNIVHLDLLLYFIPHFVSFYNTHLNITSSGQGWLWCFMVLLNISPNYYIIYIWMMFQSFQALLMFYFLQHLFYLWGNKCVLSITLHLKVNNFKTLVFFSNT